MKRPDRLSSGKDSMRGASACLCVLVNTASINTHRGCGPNQRHGLLLTRLAGCGEGDSGGGAYTLGGCGGIVGNIPPGGQDASLLLDELRKVIYQG